jgi:hypothetical protein
VRDREIAESDGVSHRLTWVSLIAAASMVSSDSSTSQCGVAEGDEAVLAGDAGKRAGEAFVDQGGDDALGDAAGAAGFVDDEDTAGGVGLTHDVLDG